jgi:hypothetical protein
MINENLKQKIDAMDYHSMLQLWRTSPLGNPLFEGDVGIYYAEVMKKKHNEIGQDEHVRISKIIGWKDK